MWRSAYTKPLTLELLRNRVALYFSQRLEKGFEVIQNNKKQKFQRNWDESLAKICLLRQFQTKYSGQSKERKQISTGIEKSDICFCIFLTAIAKVVFLDGRAPWFIDYHTAQLLSTKSELRFCTGSNPVRGVSEICDIENL